MITAIVKIRLREQMTKNEALGTFGGSAEKYRGIKGLVRKHYLLSEDGFTAGAVYLWESRPQAEAYLNDEWRKFIRDKYGEDPAVEYFETPVIVDVVSGETWREDD